ncbi:hypothetical protein [Sporosarcina ureilytica]
MEDLAESWNNSFAKRFK